MSLKTAFLKPNRTLAAGGGITSNIIPFQLNKKGVALGIAGLAGIGFVTAGLDNKHRMDMGPVTYQGGPARMTSQLNTGAVQAINQITDDPEVRADMLKNIMHDNTSIMDSIEQHGVDDQFLSAFYGMG